MNRQRRVSNKMLSKANKIRDYIKIFPKDKFIAEYIDYIGFYAPFSALGYRFFKSDNGREMYIDHILIKQENTRGGKFMAYGYYSYQGYIVNLFRLSEIMIKEQRMMKFDFYGKGLLVVNRLDLRSSIEKVLKFRDMEDLIITRTDYTVDTGVYSFAKANTLNTKIQGRIEKNGKLEYILFGRKGKSPKLLRYYDKKQEIIDRGTAWLYPEYFGLDQIMRYELQVNSEGFDKNEREIHYKDLKSYANFGILISDNGISHKRKLEHKEYDEVVKILRGLFKAQDQYQITKIRLYLDNNHLNNE